MFSDTYNVCPSLNNPHISNAVYSWTFKRHMFQKVAQLPSPGKTTQLHQVGPLEKLTWGLRLDPDD